MSPSSIHTRSKNLAQISKVNVHLKTVLNVLVKEDVTYGAAGFLGHMMNDELRTMDTRENQDVQLTSDMRHSLKWKISLAPLPKPVGVRWKV